jgi:hypothetical protein
VLQVSTPYVADLSTKSVTLGTAGNANPEILINVAVSRDSEGNVHISAD